MSDQFTTDDFELLLGIVDPGSGATCDAVICGCEARFIVFDRGSDTQTALCSMHAFRVLFTTELLFENFSDQDSIQT